MNSVSATMLYCPIKLAEMFCNNQVDGKEILASESTEPYILSEGLAGGNMN